MAFLVQGLLFLAWAFWCSRYSHVLQFNTLVKLVHSFASKQQLNSSSTAQYGSATSVTASTSKGGVTGCNFGKVKRITP